MLFTHVEAAISQIQTAETELNAHSGLEHGSISIGASETALNIYLLDILKPFHMKHPGIRLKIYNHSTPQAIRSVKTVKLILLLYQRRPTWIPLEGIAFAALP